jgi:hypothetical protein
MKALTYGSLLVMLTVLSWPTTSEAFSRRSHHSELAQSQTFTSSNTSTTENGNVSAQAVPEPPVLLLMTVALGLLGLSAAIKRFRKQA